VIAGRHKGRRLKSPSWEGLRPTSDKLRETLFNVIAPRVAGARVVDAFAGTGAVGIEALSRGAREAVFIERDPRASALIEENLAHCGIREGYVIIRAPFGRGARDLAAQPGFVPFDIVLLDPPYQQDLGAEAVADVLTEAAPLVAADGLVVLEHRRTADLPAAVARLARSRTIVSGDSALSLYAVAG